MYLGGGSLSAESSQNMQGIFVRCKTWKLAIRVALAVHSWGNTLQEKARAEAVEQIIHARLRERV
jgi:hypothetical protein